MAWSDRLLHDDDFDLEAEERKTKIAILAKHPEYQYVKAELGRQLGLGPDDINPLDVDFDQEWESADDPGIEAWKRAIHLRHRLSVAHFDWLCWWRRPAQLKLGLRGRDVCPARAWRSGMIRLADIQFSDPS